jgi:hypothetical protein
MEGNLMTRHQSTAGSGWSLSIGATTALCLVAIAASTAAACGNRSRPVTLTQQVEARRLASSLRIQFSKAADASNRAVMQVTDEASSAAAREAEQATQAAGRDVETLRQILEALAYGDAIGHLDAFKACLGGYRALDADILPLAVENTNIKAQRLSFGPAHEAANAFRQALDAAARLIAANRCCVEALIAKAAASLLEAQVIQARHIAESDEAAMSQMERDMAASEAAARKAVDGLKQIGTPAAAPQLAAATAALDRFNVITAELVTLSRRNSNVRSLALSLGKKRMVTAECDDILHALDQTLARHNLAATR